MRIKIRLVSTAGTGHFYTTTKNQRKHPEKVRRLKYDPVARKRVEYIGREDLSDSRWDLAGIAGSTLCAIHCATLPFITAALPALGLAWLGSPAFAWTAIGLTAAVGAGALARGLRDHGDRSPAALAAAGFALLVIGERLAEVSVIAAAVSSASGGVAVAAAHLRNLRLASGAPPARS